MHHLYTYTLRVQKQRFLCLIKKRKKSVDRSGRPLQKSVDRRAQACAPAWTGGPVDRAVDRPESSASGNGLGRPAESCCSLYPVPVDRVVDRQRVAAVGPEIMPIAELFLLALMDANTRDLSWFGPRDLHPVPKPPA